MEYGYFERRLSSKDAEISRLKARADKWQAIAVELGKQASNVDYKERPYALDDALAKLQSMKGEAE